MVFFFKIPYNVMRVTRIIHKFDILFLYYYKIIRIDSAHRAGEDAHIVF